jgi:Raf kinase inhibitor-like YbhB/YbcL family protein
VIGDLLTVAVLGWVGWRLLTTAREASRRHYRGRVREVLRGLQPHHFLLAVPVLLFVLIAAAALLAIPPLRFGWWTALGGAGNPVVGSTSRTNGTPLEWIIPAVFIMLLVPALPLLVEREEQIFRAGSEYRTGVERARVAVMFGLAHALIGIPIGVAIALSIGGWYFTWAYLRAYRRNGREAGLLESTRSHLAYNLTVVMIVGVSLIVAACTQSRSTPAETNTKAAETIGLTSPAFGERQAIPVHYTCDGSNVSPALHWSGVPSHTKELVLEVTDPDAPGGTFVHWVLFHLAPTLTAIDEGKVPDGGRQARNSYGSATYRGPCPPKGAAPHRYDFTLFALPSSIDAVNGASHQSVSHKIKDVLAVGRLTGLYGR